MANKLYLWRRRLITQLANYLHLFVRGQFQAASPEFYSKINLADIVSICQGNISTASPELRGFMEAASALVGQGNLIIAPIQFNGTANIDVTLIGSGYLIIPEIKLEGTSIISDVIPPTGNISVATVELAGVPTAAVAMLPCGAIVIEDPELRGNCTISQILQACIGSISVGAFAFSGSAAVPDVTAVVFGQINMHEDMRTIVANAEQNSYVMVANEANGWTYIIKAADYAWDGNSVRVGGKSGS